MNKYKIKNSNNAKEFPTQKEDYFSPSLTVPDESLSIRQIMQRYARGLPLNTKVPQYYGEDTDGIYDLRKLDLSEQAEYLENAEQELNSLTTKINANKTRKPSKPQNTSNEQENIPE